MVGQDIHPVYQQVHLKSPTESAVHWLCKRTQHTSDDCWLLLALTTRCWPRFLGLSTDERKAYVLRPIYISTNSPHLICVMHLKMAAICTLSAILNHILFPITPSTERFRIERNNFLSRSNVLSKQLIMPGVVSGLQILATVIYRGRWSLLKGFISFAITATGARIST